MPAGNSDGDQAKCEHQMQGVFRVDVKKVSASQVADSMQWVAYALILVFVAQVLTAAFPLALIQPQWMVRFSASLRGTASLPLIALVLLMLANLIDGGVLPSSNHLRLLRRIALAVAIGFLLLIPVQTYGSVVGIGNQVREGRTQLNALVSAANQIQKATSEAQLREAIRLLPGGEQLATRPLGADLQTIKTGLLGRLRPTVKRLENQLKDNQDKALQNTILPLVRDGLICVAYALGFAGMASGGKGKPTLLRRLLKPYSASLRSSKVSDDLDS